MNGGTTSGWVWGYNGCMAVDSSHRRVSFRSWIARGLVVVVFIVNVQCALGFIFDPGSFASSYQLSGTAGNAAVAGLGVAFLMWNVTYVPVLVSPKRFRAVFAVVLAQQVVGLVGESFILSTLPADTALLAASIQRFIAFDAFGLVLLLVAFFITRRSVS